MNRIMTAMALSAMFVAAPAFARKHADKPAATVAGDSKAPVADKAVAGDSKTETKTETKTEAAPADASAKPAKKVKKSKKTEKTTEAAPAPAAGSEAPATK
jgi:hypothetical protein